MLIGYYRTCKSLFHSSHSTLLFYSVQYALLILIRSFPSRFSFLALFCFYTAYCLLPTFYFVSFSTANCQLLTANFELYTFHHSHFTFHSVLVLFNSCFAFLLPTVYCLLFTLHFALCPLSFAL